MKKFKLNKIGRRFWRTVCVLFGLLVIWNIYYFSTFTRFRESAPITTTVSHPDYKNPIAEATTVLAAIGEDKKLPSFSVAVGHHGKVIWSAAVGYQDIDAGIAATPKTQYRIGSTSKAVTTTGIARAVDAHRIQLEVIIGDTIVNWTKKKWDFSMQQLLSHTAGVGNYEDFGIASAKYTMCNCHEFTTASEGLTVFDPYDLIFEPGTSFAYSTFDINLASVVLEQAVGTPFLEYMEANIFQPLGMKDTYGDHNRPKTEDFATFYETRNEYYREFRSFEQVYDINLSYKWAGGGFISTPTDLVKMGNAYLKDDSFISHDTKRKFWTPMKLDNGEVNEQLYALGWRSYLDYTNPNLLDGKTPVWMVHHGGVSKGSQNFLILFPNYDLVIDASINTNVADFGIFSDEVYKIANVFLKTIEKKEKVLYREIKLSIEEASVK
ncbi:serine hydrolase [uncultured Dokdonia sp.]|uniref:serine hydrolase domain-containing protein n=1 Tax=uncultured Dokdonia sp. TaxID=575653 RepID=UPI0026093296|nr:serine hydrolase [uncultured Dokdonia sp.]